MSGIKDIAKKTGLSLATISRVFNNSDIVSDTTREKVLKAAKELDYQPNLTAAALRSGKSKIIGVIVPEINNPFFSSIINGIEQIAEQHDYRIIIAQSHESKFKEQVAIQSLIKLNVDGILISISQETKGFPFLNKLESNKIPVVFFDRTPSEKNIKQVVLDDYGGAFIATEHLIQQGCRSILHIAGNQEISIYRERKKGFKSALLKYSLSYSEQGVIELEMNPTDDSKTLSNIINKNPVDGMFIHGDECCIHVLTILKKLKVDVPKEIKLIGFGNLKFSTLTQPTISTIDQCDNEMGKSAAHALINTLQGSDITLKKVLSPKLIIRESSAI